MPFIRELRDGEKVQGVYLVKEKRSAVTRNGKSYETLTLQDKTGTVNAKIWEPESPGIYEFEAMDFVAVTAEVTSFNNALQLNIRTARRAPAGTYREADYFAVTGKNVEEMFAALLAAADSVQNPYLHALLDAFFREDAAFIEAFRSHSAAKTVHHSFAGGLLEHTGNVVALAAYFAAHYPQINRDLLITAALCHDVGKVKELSRLPQNDYTDEGQLLGHIVIGTEMISEKIRGIAGFPADLAAQLKHCILAHHGAYEFGSPKLPGTLEALAVHLADNADAKLQIMLELLEEKGPKADKNGWIGYSKHFESNIRKTTVSS